MTEGHARVILSIDNLEKQIALAEMIVKNGWTVRQTEEFAREFKQSTATTETAHKRIAGESDLTRSLGDYLGTKVGLVHTAKGGRLIIEFYSDEELNRIFETIKKD
jgi:ParB family chromosome partitioning protein